MRSCLIFFIIKSYDTFMNNYRLLNIYSIITYLVQIKAFLYDQYDRK